MGILPRRNDGAPVEPDGEPAEAPDLEHFAEDGCMRWVIGDLHGCLRELEDFLATVRFTPGRDELWSVGDLINTGPDSPGVLRLWRELGGRGVIGNHDVYGLLAHSERWPRKGRDQLDALYRSPDGPALLETLRKLPVLVRLASSGGGPDCWLVHAGLHPHWDDLDAVAARTAGPPFDDERLQGAELRFATQVRCCSASGVLSRAAGPPGACREPYRPWDAWYRGDVMVVHGHWAMRGHYRGPRAMGLDSGCVYGGTLTGWCQEEDRIVQVASRQPKQGGAGH